MKKAKRKAGPTERRAAQVAAAQKRYNDKRADVVKAAVKVVEAERALWKVETNYPGPRRGWGPAIAHARVQLVAAREIQSAAVERLERKR